MKIKLVCLGLAVMMSMACGGGGSSSRAAPPADDNSTNPPPAGGGGGSGASVVSGGLIGGSAGLILDTGASSVTLDVAFGGTGLRGASFVTGDIQAFGSVIANGVTSNTDTAEFIIEGASGSQTDLQQGQQILIVNDDSDSAVAVVYRANIKGPVTDFQLVDPALGRAELTVLGQRVTTDATTTFANLNLVDFAGSATGSLLEISGVSGEDGVIDATFVELETSLAAYKITGVAANVGATAFTLGGLTIDYASAAITNFNSGAISNGDVLEVRGIAADFTGPDLFAAQTVERLPDLIIGTTTLVRLEGFIDDFDNAASFSVQTTPIVTDGATRFSNGEQDDLDLGTKVQLVGTADDSGAVRASSITVQPTNTLRAEGNIESLAANRITVLGVEFEIRNLTRFEDDSDADLEPLLFNQLAIGDEVELRGYLDGISYVATQIEREDQDEEAQLRGIVTAIDAINGSLSINGTSINTTAGITEFKLDDDSDTTQAAFFDAIEPGSFVTADWEVFVDTDQTVDQLSIEDD